MVKLELELIELKSAAWQKVKKYLEDTLAELDKQNRGDLDPVKTSRVRGRIEQVNEMLKAGEEKPEFKPVAHPSDTR